MKPAIEADETLTRSHKASAGDGTASTRPMTFVLTRDPDHIYSSSRPKIQTSDLSATLPKKESSDSLRRQSRGVQIKTTSRERSTNNRRRSTIKPDSIEVSDKRVGSEHSPDIQYRSEASLSRSFQSSPTSASSSNTTDGSPSDGPTNQAIVSSDDEDVQAGEASMDGSAPQLVMPSINMPSRRPFTDRGKQLGRLKILVTGCQGSGRTSLIKSIVQLCEHIVHIDTLSSNAFPENTADERHLSISETYASTKPYPDWWSDIDESRILKRRKSMGNSILERNVCFVDTTGSGKVDKTLAYLEQQFFHSINSINRPGNELRNLLSGRGGSQVDLVLYLMTLDTLKIDVERIKKLSRLVTVIPLIAKADLLSDDQIASFRSSVSFTDCALPQLPSAGKNTPASNSTLPYCVSSANGPDFDNMDASLLMSPEYVQPLLPSDLFSLIDQIFHPTIAEYLRHASGKKLVTWYASNPRLTNPASPSLKSTPQSVLDSPTAHSFTHSGALKTVASEVSLNTSNSFALAKVADHSQREEHLAQIRLCKWASELQLSLQRERERYESMAQNERALWLVQKMGEEIRDGQIVPIQQHGSSIQNGVGGRASTLHYMTYGKYEIYDPLGLLRWQDIIRSQGWIMLQVLGSFGVVGGVTIWLAKTLGWTNSLQQWAQDWGLTWYGKE